MRVVIALILVLLPTVAVAQPSQGVVTMPSGVGATRADRIGSAEVSVRAGQVYDVAADRLRTLAPAETASTWADLVTGPDFLSLPEDFSRRLWRGELERTATETTFLPGADASGNTWATLLDQLRRTSPMSLVLA